MGLFARLTATDNTKIHVHRFGAALREWATGGVTRQQVIDAFGLTGDEVTELDAIAAAYTALPSGNAAQALAKANWLHRMEDIFILTEEGDYNETQAKSRLVLNERQLRNRQTEYHDRGRNVHRGQWRSGDHAVGFDMCYLLVERVGFDEQWDAHDESAGDRRGGIVKQLFCSREL